MSLRSLFTNKKLQKRGREIFDKLVKQMQVNSAMLKDLIAAWAQGDQAQVDKLTKQIIEGERESDIFKDELIESVLAKRAFLPYTTEDRYTLINMIDNIVGATEDAARLIIVQIIPSKEIPSTLPSMAEKTWICTDKLQDSIKYLYKDFRKAAKLGQEVEDIREEARDLYYESLEAILGEAGRSPLVAIYLQNVAVAILEVALRAEVTADFVQKLAVVHR
ncbi:MAG: DUF47 domain-containing protein [Candidatus Hodarchaeales archaeon]